MIAVMQFFGSMPSLSAGVRDRERADGITDSVGQPRLFSTLMDSRTPVTSTRFTNGSFPRELEVQAHVPPSAQRLAPSPRKGIFRDGSDGRTNG